MQNENCRRPRLISLHKMPALINATAPTTSDPIISEPLALSSFLGSKSARKIRSSLLAGLLLTDDGKNKDATEQASGAALACVLESAAIFNQPALQLVNESRVLQVFPQ